VSARALQQLAVRMHHDPGFVAAVYDDPEGSLADEDLAPGEARLLVQPDRRAWGADSERRTRVLAALELEFPVSFALAEQASGDQEALLPFFGSDAFHDCVRRFEPLVFAFCSYLQNRAGQAEALPGRAVAETALLEQALARVRRSPERMQTSSSDLLTLAPWADVLEVPSGTLVLFEAVREQLEGKSRTPLPPLDDSRSEHLVVERGGNTEDLCIGYLPSALYIILDGARNGAAREDLLALARAQGAEVGEDEDAIRSLEADGLLVGVEQAPA